MNESVLYKELGVLTKDKSKWEENIPYVSSLLDHESVKIQAKALWLLGEMGLVYPLSAQDAVPAIASFCDSPVPLLRERAVNALGRIGRGSYQVIEPYWENLFRFANDEEPKVRLSFIWASENIATNTPDNYENYMPIFEELLHDADDKVRMEAPEIFRVIGVRSALYGTAPANSGNRREPCSKNSLSGSNQGDRVELGKSKFYRCFHMLYHA